MGLGIRACLAVAAATIAASVPAAAVHAVSVPQLTVQVDNGVNGVVAGATVTYQVLVSNGGTDPSTIRIAIAPPAGMTNLVANSDGKVGADGVAWNTTVAAGQTAQVTLAGSFAEVAGEQPRVALTACVFADGAMSPTICSTDIDAVQTTGGAAWWVIGAVLFVGAVAAAMFFYTRSRRNAARNKPAYEPKRVKKKEPQLVAVAAGTAASTTASSVDPAQGETATFAEFPAEPVATPEAWAESTFHAEDQVIQAQEQPADQLQPVHPDDDWR